jgi:hypothetical protein
MKTITIKVYQCEHCNKKMFGAGAMARHEKYCPSNPVNQHKCFDYCMFLTRKVTPGGMNDDMDDYIPKKTEMICEKTGQKMYSYKWEKRASLIKDYQLDPFSMVRMPLQCKDHMYMPGNDPMW